MATHKIQKEKLTPVQERFCQEYVKDFHGAKAYSRASGSKNMKACGVAASKLNKEPKIIERQRVLTTDILGPLEKELIGNVKFWIKVRDGELPGEGKGKLISLEEVNKILETNGLEDDESYKEINDIKTYLVNTTRLTDRMKASEMLAKWRQMFVEKSEVAVEGKVVIVDDIPEGK